MSLFAFGPSRGPRWQIGLQAGVGIAAPIALMTLIGHPLLGYFAASGAFTVLFAASSPVAERVRVLPIVAGALVLSAALGAAAAASPVTVTVGIVVVAIVSATLAFGFRLGPPGPLFFVLVFGLSATVASSAPVPGWVYVSAVAAGCVFCLLVSAAPLLLRRMRAVRARPLRRLFPGPAWDADAKLLILRVAIVSAVGVPVGLWLDPARMYWVVGAAIAVVGVATTRRAAFERALHRLLGTIVGAGAYVLLAALHPSGLWLALLLGVLQFSIELVVVRNYALALTLITPLVLLLLGAATGTSGDLGIALERVIDTLAGAALGALSGLVHPRARAEPRA
ncbi:FUSC family protein [Microbacterium sp. NPDC058342]|uniref:FUSC family protein n=1 Tax=Microbacterium sp. NPDC058342 TaxID=3346454 RepID=UPI00365EEB22